MEHERAFDWCYTFNDVPQDETTLRDVWLPQLEADLDAALDRGDIKHYAATLERGRKKRRLHFHVFLQFPDRQRPTRWLGILSDTSLFAACKPDRRHRLGSPAECEEYHGKEETRVTEPIAGGKLQPDRTGRGHRSDLDFVGERIRDGAGPAVIAREFTGTYIRYARGIHATCDILYRPQTLDSNPGRHYSLEGGG